MEPVLIAGLGNPGAEYEGTRHNAGFMLVDRLCGELGIPMTQTKFGGIFGSGTLGGRRIYVLKPQTFMNLSGNSVSPCMAFYHLKVSSLIVIHDDLDLPVGDVRAKEGGGTGGHNGLKSICGLVGDGFGRIRIGVGRPPKGDVINYVLGRFPASELESLESSIEIGAAALKRFVTDGGQAAMRYCNGLFRARKKELAEDGQS